MDLRIHSGRGRRLRARQAARGRDHLRWPGAPGRRRGGLGRRGMWEGLARTERQDRVLHGTAKFANVLLGLVLLPLWLFGQVIGGRLRDWLMKLEQRGKRPLPVPPERERTMDALMADLQTIPEHLRHSDLAELRKGFADISNFVVAQHREGAVIGYRYPGQFKDHIVEGADGERIEIGR